MRDDGFLTYSEGVRMENVRNGTVFSTKAVLPHRRHAATFRDSFGCHTGGLLLAFSV